MNKFQRMVRSLPSLYQAETNVMVGGLLKAWGLSDDNISVQLKNTKDQLFVSTANGRFLDALGTNVGVDRAPELGMTDEDFRKLIPVMSFYPKQVRETIIALLDIFWGPGFTRPNISSGNIETFNFGPENGITGTLTFKKDERIVKGVGTAFISEIQPGDYIRPQSLDGKNYYKVSAILDNSTIQLSVPWTGNTMVNTTGVIGTIQDLEYEVDSRERRTIRFLPNAFADLNAVTIDELVSFINSNIEHNIFISASEFIDPILGKKLNLRTNTPGLQGSIQILGGTANDVTRLNFSNDISTETKCKVLEINPNEIVIQIPSSVPILRRSLRGAAHPRETKAKIQSLEQVFDFSGLGASSELDITIDGNNFTVTFTHATDFADPSKATSLEVAAVINAQLLGVEAKTSSNFEEQKALTLQTTEGSLEYQITGGTANTVLNFPTTLQQDPDLIDINLPSPYVFSPLEQLYTVTGVSSELLNPIAEGDVSSTLNLVNAASFPNEPGKIMIDFGRDTEEGPINYSSRPNNSTLLIDASYTFQYNHLAGRKVNFVENTPSRPRVTGEDYAFYVTGTEQAREAAQALIRKLIAAGVVIRFIIDFPEFLFICECRECGPSDDTNYRGSRTGQGPLVF